MPTLKSLAAVPAMIAALSLTATPAAAADLPIAQPKSAYASAPAAWSKEDQSWNQYRRYHPYRGYRGHRYRRGPSVGDVLTGLFIIGTIAAVADAAKDSDDRRYREPRYPDRDDRRSEETRGIDGAVDRCVSAVERERRVEGVDVTQRTAQGWQVEGRTAGGESFACRINQDGRIGNIDFGAPRWEGSGSDDERYPEQGYGQSSVQNDQQWDDARYRAEWDRVNGTGDVAVAQAPVTPQAQQPAYPGGPLPGEEAWPDNAANPADYGVGGN